MLFSAKARTHRTPARQRSLRAALPFGAIMLLSCFGFAGPARADEGWSRLEPQGTILRPRVVLRDDAGREIENLQGFTGNVRWYIEDRDSVPRQAIEWHERARQAGSAGNYDESLRLLWRAHVAAPGWLYPVYDAAYTYFLKSDMNGAERLYAWVDRAEPRGYWTCKEALDCIRREKGGEYPRGAYAAYSRLEWIESRPERRDSLEALVQRVPTLAPAWKDLAAMRDTPEGKMKAIEAGLASRPDPETRGQLLIQKALHLSREEGASLLENLLADSTSTLQTVAVARILSTRFAREAK